MKKIYLTLTALLLTSISVTAQNDSTMLCRANFKWEVNDKIMMFAPGMAINFYDASEGDVVSWLWDFGDGYTSEEQNPMHIYTFLDGTDPAIDEAGVFVPTACLTITTMDSCSSTICKTLEIRPDTIIYPDTGCYVYFHPYINDTVITIPEIIPYSFRVSAPENTLSWFWDFGDGTTSEEADPVHGFDFMGGVFDVCLTITTEDSCTNSYCAPVFTGNIDTIPPPDCEAYFNWSVLYSYPAQYAFQDLSRGAAPTAWFWDFGDGTFSTEQNPVHVYPERNDSLYDQGYLGPPIADHYQVCLTILNDENCKSTYCDYVFTGGIRDTILPQPCPYFISLTTSNILGGNYCNGTAGAGLVDAEGNPVEATEFYWSTGETGPTTGNLCVNVPYYVSITAEEGCQVIGSFALIDYTQPMDPIGYWTIVGDESSYELDYKAPGAGYTVVWEFSDGTTLTGENVNYDVAGNSSESVILNVFDSGGNLVYSVEIALNQATAVNAPEAPALSLYPNPAYNEIHILTGEQVRGNVRVEIYNSLGQQLISENYTDASPWSEITVPVSSLERGIYYARITGSGNSPVTLSFVKID